MRSVVNIKVLCCLVLSVVVAVVASVEACAFAVCDNPISAEMPSQMDDAAMAKYIVISKEAMTLELYDSSDRLICRFGVAVGKNYGNKQRSGDMKTPEGEFYIEQIQPASHWGHDFKDGKGYIPNCYGNWFMRLKTPPHKGIGIHGTHAPESIGTRATEGCVRLKNSELDSLHRMVHVGMPVRIESSLLDRRADGVVE